MENTMNTNKEFPDKPVLMIHELTEEMFDLPLKDYILTFDDGLVTPLKYLDALIALDTPKVFFITTGITCPEEKDQDLISISSEDAHEKAFDGNFTNYLKWSDIKMMNTFNNFYIGGHAHFHSKLWTFKSIRAKHIMANKEVQNMMLAFKKNRIETDMYCYCYNYEDFILKGLLEREGFKTFYGQERISVESLLEERCLT